MLNKLIIKTSPLSEPSGTPLRTTSLDQMLSFFLSLCLQHVLLNVLCMSQNFRWESFWNSRCWFLTKFLYFSSLVESSSWVLEFCSHSKIDVYSLQQCSFGSVQLNMRSMWIFNLGFSHTVYRTRGGSTELLLSARLHRWLQAKYPGASAVRPCQVLPGIRSRQENDETCQQGIFSGFEIK